MEEAAIDWANEYSNVTASDHRERGAIILSKTIDGQKYYYTGLSDRFILHSLDFMV